MGFFSGNCLHCDKSIISNYALTEKLAEHGGERLTRIVLLRKNVFILGIYGGYGDIYDLDSGEQLASEVFHYDEDSVFHEACWRKVGCPMWSEELPKSDRSWDQGFFIEEEEYLEQLLKMDKYQNHKT